MKWNPSFFFRNRSSRSRRYYRIFDYTKNLIKNDTSLPLHVDFNNVGIDSRQVSVLTTWWVLSVHQLSTVIRKSMNYKYIRKI